MNPITRPAAVVCEDPKHRGFAILRDKELAPHTALYTWQQVMETLKAHVVITPKGETITDIRPESRQHMVDHLRKIATELQNGAMPTRGGMSASGPYSLYADIELSPAPPMPAPAAEQPGSSVQGEADAALLRMFRAIVDAGGPATIARHGVERGGDAWAEEVRAGMLAIERRFHPERFDDYTPPPAPAAERLARCHDCHEPTAGQHICLGCAELRTESVADAVRSVQPEAREVEGMARELLAAEYDRVGSKRIAEELRTTSAAEFGDKDFGLAIRAISAALATPNPVRAEQPEGMVLVPREPTQEMLDAPDHMWQPEAKKVWTAMLAAAPAAPGVRVDEAVSRACHPYVASDGSMHASLDAAERHDAPDGGEGE